MIRPFYLVCCIFASCLVAEQPPKYALLGKTVILDPFGATISPDDILWKHKGDKVVEFNGNEELTYGAFEDRITLDWHSAELTISDLRHEDSGVYALEAYTKKELKRASFTLEVIDRVAKPTVSCDMNNGNSSIKSGSQATLRCSAEARLSPSLMKFEWNSHGKTQLGENLIIPLGDGHDDEVYDCTVSNPLTKESTTFTAKECYPDRGSAGLAAGIGVAIIAAILIILAVVFCIRKRKACFAKENRHDAENPPGKTKVPENSAAQNDERRGLLHRESTLASQQPLRYLKQHEINCQNGDTEDSDQDYKQRPVKEHIERLERNSVKKKAAGLEEDKQTRAASPRPLDSAVLLVKEEERNPLDSKESNDMSGDESENKNSDLQPTIVSEQPGSEEKGDEETKSPSPVDGHLPAAEPHLLVTENSQNQSPQDGSGEHEDQTVSSQQDQDTTEKNEGDSSEPEEGKQPEDLNKKSPGVEEEAGATQSHVPVTENSQNPSPQDGSGEHEDQTVSHQQDQDTTEKNEGDSSEGEEGEQPANIKNKRASEENIQIQAESPGPLDSAENNKLPEERGDPSDSEKSNSVSGSTSDLQSATASEQPGAEEEAGATQPHVPVTENSQKQSPQDGSGEHEDETVSDQQDQDTTGNNEGLEEDKQIPAATSGPQDSAENGKGDADVESPKESAENKDLSDSNQSDVVSDDKSENAESDQQPSTASEPLVSPETQDAPNIAPQDGASEPEKDSSSDQITGGTTYLSQGGSDLNSKEENGSNDHSHVKDNSTISDQKAAETKVEQNSQQEETHQGEDSQQENDNSEDNHDSDSANEQEKIDQNKKLPPDPPPKPQRTITPKPDNSNTSTSPVTEHAVPDEKEKD